MPRSRSRSKGNRAKGNPFEALALPTQGGPPWAREEAPEEEEQEKEESSSSAGAQGGNSNSDGKIYDIVTSYPDDRHETIPS